MDSRYGLFGRSPNKGVRDLRLLETIPWSGRSTDEGVRDLCFVETSLLLRPGRSADEGVRDLQSRDTGSQTGPAARQHHSPASSPADWPRQPGSTTAQSPVHHRLAQADRQHHSPVSSPPQTGPSRQAAPQSSLRSSTDWPQQPGSTTAQSPQG